MLDEVIFDLSDPAFSLHSPQIRAARERSWYVRTNYGIAVLRYDAVKELVKDRRLRQGSWAWPDKNGVHSGYFHDFWSSTLINYEGDDHGRLRRLHNPAFSSKAINALVPQFQVLATELIDDFIDRREAEYMEDFAEPYAARVIAILLGIPESDWRLFAGWAATIGLALGVNIQKELPNIEQAFVEMYEYVETAIQDRREHPREDFITTLVQTTEDSDRMSPKELRVAIANGIFAGMDTTRNQLGLAMSVFLAHPEQWELLAQRPDLARNAVEEVMRIAPTTTWITREALEDFEYQGLLIEQGTTLHLLTESSGTDPLAMEHPEFDITAERPPHFGFGGGAHHCLGHFVARTDMTEALKLMSARIRDIRALPGAEWLPISGNTGPVRLPFAFEIR